MDSRLPPQNLEAEQSVLGGVLLDNQSFDRVADTLSTHDFYRPAHSKIFNSMLEL
ncbi:MAG: DnaB-like helicase N-terminal domain-containing protein, partial [Pseudomonadota bacterium]